MVSERPHASISALHKQWVKLEDEHHQLATAIDEARTAGTDLTPMRQRQIKLLLEITSIVAEIRDAPATTTEDFLALLDVALEHELDLACSCARWQARFRGLNSTRCGDGCRYRVSSSS